VEEVVIIAIFAVMLAITLVILAYPLLRREAVPAGAPNTSEAVGVCASCGRPLEADDAFCPQCGAPVGARCPACGRRLEGDERFCPRCGRPVGKV
jgi:predicted amidophosphoribosyltransferase